MEVLSKETKQLIDQQQRLLRQILEAAKKSEHSLNEAIERNRTAVRTIQVKQFSMYSHKHVHFT